MFHLIFNYNPAVRGFAMFDQVKVGGAEENFHGLPSQISEFFKNSEIFILA